MTKFSSVGLFFWISLCSMLMAHAASQPIAPKLQTHTHKKNANVFGQAILQPESGSDLAGTVEFQKLDPNNIRIVMTLANGEPGASYKVELVNSNRCPANQTTGEKQDADSRVSPVVQKLGNVKILEARSGVASVNRHEAVAMKPANNGYVNKMVVVSEADSAKKNWLACGVIDSTEQALK